MEKIETKQINMEAAVAKQRAGALGMEVDDFTSQLMAANTAYDNFVQLGPFYGKGEKGLTIPTFRVASRPVTIPASYQSQLEGLGQDLFQLARALPQLPEEYLLRLGPAIAFEVPIAVRIDAILSSDDRLKVNEIQIDDGADGLMTGEQLAYEVKTLGESTPFWMAKAIRANSNTTNEAVFELAWLKETAQDNYLTNTGRMAEYLEEVSGGNIRSTILFGDDLTSERVASFDGIMNGTYMTGAQLREINSQNRIILSAGTCSVLENKGVFGLLGTEQLAGFFENRIGREGYLRLRESLIASRFAEPSEDLIKTVEKGEVVKAYWAPQLDMLDRSRGVFGPWSDEEQIALMTKTQQDGGRFIAQEFVEPKKFEALLRAKGGKSLERVNWYNRLCVKYVVDGKVCDDTSPVVLTAMEMTLGSSIKPSGRDCCFVPAVFDNN